MNEHAIYEVVGSKRQRCVEIRICRSHLLSNAHHRPSVSGLRKQWCPEIVDLLERMWAHDHQDRPTMTEVVTELEELVRKYK
jgi:mitogen-activated protein kinase kinase kinase 13